MKRLVLLAIPIPLLLLALNDWLDLLHTREGGNWSGCYSNLRNLHTAIDIYREQHDGRLPDNLAKLTPEVLKRLPICPAAGRLSYRYNRNSEGYLLVCSGESHRQGVVRLPPDYPRADARGVEPGESDGPLFPKRAAMTNHLMWRLGAR